MLKQLDIEIPDDVFSALSEEAKKMGVSLDEMASSILRKEVCVTSEEKKEVA